MKYIGSKAKIAADIVPILQGYINEYGIKQYVEPFVGGFNIIDKIECENRLGNDIDPLVCELVETCRENPALLDGLTTPTREEYYDVRDKPEKYAGWYRAAVLLFASYNARVYGGCYGAIATTKGGTTRNYFEESKANFKSSCRTCTAFWSGVATIGKCAFRRAKRCLFIATRLMRRASDTQNISTPPRFGNGAENAPRKGISSLSANTPHRPILLACGSGA